MKIDNEKVIEVLTAVIARMQYEAEYNALYNAYLLEQIGEEEFEALSAELISSTKFDENVFYKSGDKKLSNQELDDNDKEKIDILFQCTKKRFTPTEIGDIFFLNDKIVEKYLEEKYAA